MLTSCSAGLAMFAVSLLTAAAEFALPRMKLPPVALRAVVATPNTNASIIAKPTTVVVVLAIHVTLLAAFLNMPILLARSHVTKAAYSLDEA